MFVKDCLVTCNACDSYTCSNPQPESVLNCTALASQCDSGTFSEFMKSFCNTVDYYDLLSAECPSTCNRCPLNATVTPGTGGQNGTQGCADVATDCSVNLSRCSDPQYAPLMHRLCAKTCNACTTCEDANKMCTTWVARGFCTKYSQPVIMKTCPKSCDMCK
uniref:ShKT domain-containing protein n=1 Tax=Caenorhabditis japonica TaxID=281687 RepID=A0A8R1ETS3_CAEJA